MHNTYLYLCIKTLTNSKYLALGFPFYFKLPYKEKRVSLWHFHMYFFLITILFYFICMGVLPACLSVYHMHVVPPEAGRWHWIPGTGLTNGRDSSCGCWESNWDLCKCNPISLLLRHLPSSSWGDFQSLVLARWMSWVYAHYLILT